MAKIKSIEYFRVKPRWLFVKVTDEQGRSGWGEGTLEGHTQAVEGALDEIIARIIGYEAEYVTFTQKPYDFYKLTLPATSNTSGRPSGGWASTAAAPSSCLPCPALISPCGISRLAIWECPFTSFSEEKCATRCRSTAGLEAIDPAMSRTRREWPYSYN